MIRSWFSLSHPPFPPGSAGFVRRLRGLRWLVYPNCGLHRLYESVRYTEAAAITRDPPMLVPGEKSPWALEDADALALAPEPARRRDSWKLTNAPERTGASDEFPIVASIASSRRIARRRR
jgi:hypothetical protein